jgi:hypothetical protein
MAILFPMHFIHGYSCLTPSGLKENDWK